MRSSFRAGWLARRLVFALCFATAVLPAALGATGGQIYMQQCASCHGKKGEGVAEKHDEPLYGDRSLKSLARLIERTMPEDEPEKCVGEDAEKVAAYIYEEFYSPSARARMFPPEIAVSRLTVPQFQNSVADLFASFRGEAKPGDEPGLEGLYYDARNFKHDKKAFERIDPRVEFAFGESSPDTNKIGLEEFAIKWNGSLLAEDSGKYEFRIKTENGARLYLNDYRKPLIDGWVSSGNEPREEHGAIELLGGRVYPIQIDFFKFKEKTASIVVEWKPPHRSWEVLSSRNLRTRRVPETLVVTTAFPPDDGSAGYERGTSISKEWDKAVTYAAIEVAGKIVDQFEQVAKVKDFEDEDARDKAKEFCAKFVERAFRRPLSEENRGMFVDQQFEGEEDIAKAVKRVVLLTLKSPRFLYTELKVDEPDDYHVASRLALGVWDSIPDAALLEAAAKGELKTESQVAAHAERMLRDHRAKAKVRGFFHHWLEMEEAEDMSKDPNAFPDFTDSIVSDLRTSLELFIEDVVWSERSDYRDLLLANYLYLNPRLAKFYGTKGEAVEGEAVDDFKKVSFPETERTGVLTHPYLLTAFAYYKSTSPIHRGVFLTRNIVGRSLKPPPAAIQFMDGKFDPKMTMREKVTELTSPLACQGCHVIINPLGFSLENYDGVGRHRLTENDRPIDATSEYVTGEGETLKLTGARDVAVHAAASEDAHRAFARQMFQHIAKQPVQAYGPEVLERLRHCFASNEFNIRKLMVEAAKTHALRGAEKSDNRKLAGTK